MAVMDRARSAMAVAGVCLLGLVVLNAAGAQDDPRPCVPAAALDIYIDQRWERRVEAWRSLGGPQGGVVFLGSSIIEEGPWSQLFPGVETVNRGIGADTTVGVLKRLDDVAALNPSKVFLYIGGNDFARFGEPVDAVAARLQSIVSELRALDDPPEVYVHTLLAREAQHAETIQAFNAALKDGGVGEATLLDVYPLFATPDGAMDPRYSNDRIHLSIGAYQAWADMIRSHVETAETAASNP